MHLFLSYSNKDKDFAYNIKKLLVAKGHTVFIDSENIPTGIDWWNKICKEIRNKRLFFYVASKNYFESDICISELKYANACGRSTYPLLLDKYAENRINNELVNGFKFDRNDMLNSTADFINDFSKLKESDLNTLVNPIPQSPEYPSAKTSTIFILLNKDNMEETDQIAFLNAFSALLPHKKKFSKNMKDAGRRFLSKNEILPAISAEFRPMYKKMFEEKTMKISSAIGLSVLLFLAYLIVLYFISS